MKRPRKKPVVDTQTYEAIAVGLQTMLTTERNKVYDLIDALNQANRLVYANSNFTPGSSDYHKLRKLIVEAIKRNGGAVT